MHIYIDKELHLKQQQICDVQTLAIHLFGDNLLETIKKLVGQKLHLTIQFIFLLLFFIWGGGGL
jgi:hypothetical protein